MQVQIMMRAPTRDWSPLRSDKVRQQELISFHWPTSNHKRNVLQQELLDTEVSALRGYYPSWPREAAVKTAQEALERT